MEAEHDPKRWSPRAVKARISSAKNALIGPEDYAEAAFDLLSRVVRDVYPIYGRILRRRNAYDFDDLLFESVRLMEGDASIAERYSDRFLHVLVDEYQDTNHAQYRMVKAFAGRHGNIAVVGDDDQSIYAWRGADIRNILDFERDFPGAAVVRLEQNYRSTESILEVANAVISRNAQRKPKRLRTERTGGEPIVVVHAGDDRGEARWISREVRRLEGRYGLEAIAILYRTNAQSRSFEEALRRDAIGYRIVGGVPFYERREIKDVLAYLRLAVNPRDDAAFQRAVGWPRRGVGSVTLDYLGAAARGAGSGLLEASGRAAEIDGIKPAAVRGLTEFARRIDELHELQVTAEPRAVLEACVKGFGLASALQEEEDGVDRLENVTELFATAAAFDRSEVDDSAEDASDLELYLQSVSLRSEIDDADLTAEAVTLMTLHNAKGLEFPVVFVAGLEEGLFPLYRAVESEGGLEEERRLFYVGVTRAKDRLFLSHADRRWRIGIENRAGPSMFLDELPDEHVERRLAVGVDRRRSRSGLTRRDRAVPGSSAGGKELDVDEFVSGFAWRRDVAPPTTDAQPSGSSATGELRYDFSDSQVEISLAPGEVVLHPNFGEGTIVAVSGEGRAAKAEIEFEGIGRKKVMIAYAGLRPA